MRTRLYQVNKHQKSFLVSANSADEAVKILDQDLYTHNKVIALGEADTGKVEEVFPVCISEDVMSEESKYYRK